MRFAMIKKLVLQTVHRRAFPSMTKCSLLLLVTLSPVRMWGQIPERAPDLYACRGITFMEDDALPPHAGDAPRAGHALTSPDGKNEVAMIRPRIFAVSLSGRRVRTLRFPQIDASIELGWSPDSTQFFIMYSAGGAVGDFHVHVFQVRSGRVEELAYPRKAAYDFHRKHSCDSRINNLFFLGWTPDSSQAFLVAEVYPTSDCTQMSLFRGYLMDTRTNAIVHRFGEQDTNAIKKDCRYSGTVRPRFPAASRR
jgi:hypothetical protein